MNWKVWGVGLATAVVSGVMDGFLLNALDPAVFNTGAGRTALLSTSLFFGVKAGALYLKTHPTPQD